MKTFKTIPTYPGYSITKDGVILSNRQEKPKVLKTFIQVYGYHVVNLYKNKKRTTVLVHKIVMDTYGDPCPSDKHVITHLDKNKNNNHISNLKWIPRAEVTTKPPCSVKAIGIDEHDTIYFRTLTDTSRYFHTNQTVIRSKLDKKTPYKGYLLSTLKKL